VLPVDTLATETVVSELVYEILKGAVPELKLNVNVALVPGQICWLAGVIEPLGAGLPVTVMVLDEALLPHSSVVTLLIT
jgi:hypothetical protein